MGAVTISIAALIIFLITGILVALWEIYIHNHQDSIFSHEDTHSFWGARSWIRKYKYPLTPPVKRVAYHRFYKLKYQERFFLSATLLVWATDGYHLVKSLWKALFFLGLYLSLFSSAQPLLFVVASYFCLGLGFFLGYYLLWRR